MSNYENPFDIPAREKAAAAKAANTNKPSAPAQRRTNMEYKSSDKKIWDFLVPVSPDPFNPMHAWVVQRLLGDFGVPNEDGHDENGWRPAALPAATRVVYMRMTEDGQMVNVFSSANRNK